ncbi:preprotein translocase subunit SecG [Candidatus Parcubacteria bacterium]|nr:MAG: preprotein translocase subunit SecG [Candidatus Parcubacteria bacterium]
MSLSSIISIFQIVVSGILIVSVLLQQRGSSLGSSFGGVGASYHTRRGFEKLLFASTIIFGILFVISTIASLLIK